MAVASNNLEKKYFPFCGNHVFRLCISLGQKQAMSFGGLLPFLGI